MNLVGFNHYIFTNYLEVNTAFSKENVGSLKELKKQIIKFWIIIEKSGKIRSCHCTCMTGMGQFCNHVAAAMYSID